MVVLSNDPQDSLSAELARLQPGLGVLQLPVSVIDQLQRYRYANAAYLAFFGLAPGELIGRTPADVYGADLGDDRRRVLDRSLAGEFVILDRVTTAGPNLGRWVRAHYMPVRVAGQVVATAILLVDIQHLKDTEEALRENELELLRLNSILSEHLENTPLAVIEWDPDLRPKRWSGNAEAMFGWNAAEVIGRAAQDWRLLYEEDGTGIDAMVGRLAKGAISKASVVNRCHRRDGTVIWVEWHHSALHDDQGRLVSILSLAQDVSIRMKTEARLQHMATHDGLTGLPNRLILTERLNSAISRAQRLGKRVAVMFLDLDRFKDINDTLGHAMGDELLKEVSQRVRHTLRQSDLLARLSGDEFVIVLEDLEDEEGTDRVARKILDEVTQPVTLGGHEVQVSASIGLATFPDDGEDAETLLKNSDSAMYQAKNLGRSSVRAFSKTLSQRRDSQLAIAAGIMRALRHGELMLLYQPIVDLASGRVSRVEALLRWNDPLDGIRLPRTFVPVAEEVGLMRELGLWVFEAAARQAAAWNAKGLDKFTVAVNVSLSQLRDPEFVAHVEAILARTACAPAWLSLEIDEKTAVKDLETVNQNLGALRALGLTVAIDDFGTGATSLSHLRQLPVGTLKIDRSFMAEIGDDPGDAASREGRTIVAAVTGLATGLGLEVVAQGVERPSQLQLVRELGCQAYQGFLACPPVKAAELESWHAARQ